MMDRLEARSRDGTSEKSFMKKTKCLCMQMQMQMLNAPEGLNQVLF